MHHRDLTQPGYPFGGNVIFSQRAMRTAEVASTDLRAPGDDSGADAGHYLESPFYLKPTSGPLQFSGTPRPKRYVFAA